MKTSKKAVTSLPKADKKAIHTFAKNLAKFFNSEEGKKCLARLQFPDYTNYDSIALHNQWEQVILFNGKAKKYEAKHFEAGLRMLYSKLPLEAHAHFFKPVTEQLLKDIVAPLLPASAKKEEEALPFICEKEERKSEQPTSSRVDSKRPRHTHSKRKEKEKNETPISSSSRIIEHRSELSELRLVLGTDSTPLTHIKNADFGSVHKPYRNFNDLNTFLDSVNPPSSPPIASSSTQVSSLPDEPRRDRSFSDVFRKLDFSDLDAHAPTLDDICDAINDKQDDPDRLAILLSAGFAINTQDPKTGDTALHFAVQLSNPNAIKLLLAQNPDLTLKNKAGKTAGNLAQEALKTAQAVNDLFAPKQLEQKIEQNDPAPSVAADAPPRAGSWVQNVGQKPLAKVHSVRHWDVKPTTYVKL
ncbi:MAG: Ankyrin repeat (many copies) [Rickettsiales bacterium]|jgi:hypothetical protein|nr:Ankyrin repeat (many copies) [Rickettsiales bacterium]